MVALILDVTDELVVHYFMTQLHTDQTEFLSSYDTGITDIWYL